MFELEPDSCERVARRSGDAYDTELGLALSASLVPVRGAQILPPREMHRLVREKIFALVGRQSDAP